MTVGQWAQVTQVSEVTVINFNCLLYPISHLVLVQILCNLQDLFIHFSFNPLKGRDVNWLHFAIQV